VQEVRVTRWIAIGVAAVVAAAALYTWWPSDERQVRKRLEALAETASVPAEEADLARLARAQRLRASLREDVRVEFERAEWPPIVGRDPVSALVANSWPQASGGLTVELEDLSITVAADRASADARFKARLVSLDSSGEPSALDGRMVSLTLRKVDGEWLVASARILRSDDAVR
jgi:ketosteroid isomerase-like protein